MGGPRRCAPVATPPSAREWAAASARNLTRRLRRRALAAAHQGAAMDIPSRLSHLRDALRSHARLCRLIGCHKHRHGEAIAAARGHITKDEVKEEKVIKKLGDWARHSAFVHQADAAAGGLHLPPPSFSPDDHDDGFLSCCSESEQPSGQSYGHHHKTYTATHQHQKQPSHFELDDGDLADYQDTYFGEFFCVCGRQLLQPGYCFDCVDKEESEGNVVGDSGVPDIVAIHSHCADIMNNTDQQEVTECAVRHAVHHDAELSEDSDSDIEDRVFDLIERLHHIDEEEAQLRFLYLVTDGDGKGDGVLRQAFSLWECALPRYVFLRQQNQAARSSSDEYVIGKDEGHFQRQKRAPTERRQ